MAGKVMILILALLAILAVPFWAWADVYPASLEQRIKAAAQTSPRLAPQQVPDWCDLGSQAALTCVKGGVPVEVVLDLVQLSLDQGWPAAAFAEMCHRTAAEVEKGKNPTETARAVAWQALLHGSVTQQRPKEAIGTVIGAGELLHSLREWLGTPYKFGGDSKQRVDCSGRVRQVYAEQGLKLARGSFNQAKLGVGVERQDLRLGDLVTFSRPGQGVVHVGIYLHNNCFIHAAQGQGVVISSLDEKKYKAMYHGARRVAQVRMGDEQGIERAQHSSEKGGAGG